LATAPIRPNVGADIAASRAGASSGLTLRKFRGDQLELRAQPSWPASFAHGKRIAAKIVAVQLGSLPGRL
jgi:hypothetical protein